MRINKKPILIAGLALLVALILAAGYFASLAAAAGLVVLLIAAVILYDYRFRRHWTGYTFGYPLEGFDRQLFFTFDDGPSCYGKILKGDDDTGPITDPAMRRRITTEIPDYDFNKTATENLLDLLKKHNVRAIFFLWGKSIDAQPDATRIMRRMEQEGHIIGNHSYSHLYSTRENTDKILEDFARNHQLIESTIQSGPSVFRPPYGDWQPDLTKRFLAHPALKNYSFPIFWGDLFQEWALQTPDELERLDERLKAVRQDCADDRGKILLLHDIYIPSLILTAKLLNKAKELSYQIGEPATLAEAAAAESRLYRESPFWYYLTNLKQRFRLKLTAKPAQHTNYRMEQ